MLMTSGFYQKGSAASVLKMLPVENTADIVHFFAGRVLKLKRKI